MQDDRGGIAIDVHPSGEMGGHDTYPQLRHLCYFSHGTIGGYGGCLPSASCYAAWESSGGEFFEDGDPEVHRDLSAEQTRRAVGDNGTRYLPRNSSAIGVSSHHLPDVGYSEKFAAENSM
jgi:hypothetical protein